MSKQRRPKATDNDRGPEFKFVEFNPVRCGRGVEAAKVAVNGQLLWMSESDIVRNMRAFGRDPELVKAAMAYTMAGPPAFVPPAASLTASAESEAPQ